MAPQDGDLLRPGGRSPPPSHRLPANAPLPTQALRIGGHPGRCLRGSNSAASAGSHLRQLRAHLENDAPVAAPALRSRPASSIAIAKPGSFPRRDPRRSMLSNRLEPAYYFAFGAVRSLQVSLHQASIVTKGFFVSEDLLGQS